MKRFAHILFLALALAAAAISNAAPFDARAFEAAQAAGKPVLVEVHADWCPTCAKQKPVIGELLSRPDLKAYQVFTTTLLLAAMSKPNLRTTISQPAAAAFIRLAYPTMKSSALTQ